MECNQRWTASETHALFHCMVLSWFAWVRSQKHTTDSEDLLVWTTGSVTPQYKYVEQTPIRKTTIFLSPPTYR